MVGETISHYKVLSEVGRGGMGIVYKAEDLKLKRPVALKFLRSDVLEDEEHKERFLREAQAAAALDHPNICTVHEIDEVEGETFIAMAYLEGQTVKDKIAERPLKLDEALDIAIQTAQGLQAAHEKGIVHRDIKSANLMVTPQGTVKVMDFGLAQLADRSQLTKTQTMLGTPAYMSPEQARCEPTDRPTDLWSLGVVIYEMVTGKLPFVGERQEAVLYAIGNEEPEPITALRAGLPMDLEWIVSKALAKDLEDRYQRAEDMLVDLRSLSKKLASGKSTILGAQPAVASVARSDDLVPKHKQRFLQALLAVTAVFALVLSFVHFRETPPEARLRKFALTPPVSILPTGGATNVSVSPNGRHIAFTAPGPQGKLWIQDLDQQQPRAIEGTEGAILPFWSPGSDFIGFATGGGLKKVAAQGGLVIRLCELPGILLGATWSPDSNSIVFSSPDPYALYEVPARGGAANLLISAEEPSSGGPWGVIVRPHFLPLEAGARVLVFAFGSPRDNTMMVQDLETGRREILGPGNFPAYSSSGHLLYQPTFVTHEIWALPFSLDALQATGEAFPVSGNGRGPTVAADGTLVYLDGSGSGQQQLVWFDRRGERTGEITLGQEVISDFALSPDGWLVAVTATENLNSDVWVYDAAQVVKTRLTTAPQDDFFPVWSPTGEELAFSSTRRGNWDIFLQQADGSGEAKVLLATPSTEQVSDWSLDGKYFLYDLVDPENARDLWYLERNEDGSGWQTHPFLQTPFSERKARFSPDGRYAAYASNESGRYEIYVRSFPQGGRKWTVSSSGGRQPRWSRDSKELFYVEEDTLIAVSVSTTAGFTADAATRLFSLASLNRDIGSQAHTKYDISADGQRFILVEPVGEGVDAPEPSIRVVMNWFEEFRDREQD